MKIKELLKEEWIKTETLNGCAAYRTTLDACLNLFSRAGGMRSAESFYLYKKCFLPAYIENSDLAMKLLFYIRDIWMGMGEREIFRKIVERLANDYPDSVRKNIEYFGTYGRFDDLFVLLGTKCEKDMISYISRQLKKDEKNMESGNNTKISLLAKWMPSVNTSGKKTAALGKEIAKKLGMSEKEYRKRLSALRRKIGLIETDLSQKKETVSYENIPAKAMLKYHKALAKKEMFLEYLRKVDAGISKMNTLPLFPYEITRPLMKNETRLFRRNTEQKTVPEITRSFLNTMWNAKNENLGTENTLVVADGSASMYWVEREHVTPALIAQTMALFYAERNHGGFHNCFITFSMRPQLIEIKGKDLQQKLQYIQSFGEAANTDILAVFRLILKTAQENGLSQEEMPSTLYLISDMEFDQCAQNAGKTAFETAKEEYERAGYHLPVVVFHNVNSFQSQFPVKKDTKGTAMTSGSSSAVFRQKADKETTPYDFMLKVLMSKRYRPICA